MESDASMAFFLLFSSLLCLPPPFLNDRQSSIPTIKNSLFLFPFIPFSLQFQSRKLLEIDQSFCFRLQDPPICVRYDRIS
ncbi:hypothetical protein AAZV13_03G136550 [Glycine max]|uniref:Uncharacterized protein n=2 Tax=Glycine subgen. Soja TaxID=1462606 RepID=A0A0R0KS03_SOYBN|nr:hypothetical protein JHK87_007615 [Glycine soja]KAG5055487.1 hypothetical protein JHK85_007997 [Glycine max]KAG5072553.1 hypothetical protein JHK86_007764 [Glycine max]KAH1070506.1 hypothetical protein GYH30_007534 [Glycine max]RZC21171.1 hypothetical protein D0Y65_007450 [Glycine soja]